MEKVIVSKRLVIWATVLTTSWINSNNGQRLHDNRPTCYGPEELDFLQKEVNIWQKMVKDQAIKLEILEEKLNSVSEKLSMCCLSTDSTLSTGDDGERIHSLMTTRTMEAASTTSTTVSSGSRGREFLILFMRNYYRSNGNQLIYITTENETMVKISSSENLNQNIKSSVDKTMNITSDSIITIPFDLTCEYMEIEPKAIILQTSELSTVTIFDSIPVAHDTNDETLIIPTNKLSTKYIVSSSEPYSVSIDSSQFALAALYDGTRINVTFKMKNNSAITVLDRTYTDGDMFSINLERLETFQIRHTTDLSGTLITSTNVIAVFSGNRCQILLGRSCNHMVTQLPPTNELDNSYVVPPFYHTEGTLIQVISENQTFVNCSIGDNVSRFHLNKKEYKKLEVTSSETTVLVSEIPVFVTGFGMGSSRYGYDSYMTVIPGVNQYVDYYKITIPGGYTENFISVILPVESTTNLRINGSTVDRYKTVYQNYAVSKRTFNVRTFEVQMGTCVITTTDSSRFGLIVYGHRFFAGYGFAGNFVFP